MSFLLHTCFPRANQEDTDTIPASETQALASYFDRVRPGIATGAEKTSTPSSAKRLAESCGLMSAHNRRMRFMTMAKSTCTPPLLD